MLKHMTAQQLLQQCQAHWSGAFCFSQLNAVCEKAADGVHELLSDA